MKNFEISRKSILIFFFNFFSIFNYNAQLNCEILKNGKFQYLVDKDLVTIILKDKKLIEYHKGGQYIIKSKMHWISECEYELKLLKVTLPKFPYKRGDVLKVNIIEIKDNEILCRFSTKNDNWENSILKIE